MKISKIILLSFAFVSISPLAGACDICGCYNPPLESGSGSILSHFNLSVAEQFTYFGTDQLDGREVRDTTGEYMNSSITQVVLGCNFNDRFGIQLNLPFIYRNYKRPYGDEIQYGSLGGIGDITLAAHAVILKKEAGFHDRGSRSSGKEIRTDIGTGEPDFSALMVVDAGLKMPTGDPGELKQNYNDVETGGIGPHDLALGSGSWDGSFGGSTEVRWKRAFFEAGVHYSVCGPGAYQFQYANTLTWSGGPGFYPIRNEYGSAGLQLNLSGETKGYDLFQGRPDSDSSLTALYVGPRVVAVFGSIDGEIGIDLPVIMNATGYQSTPTYRIHAGVTWKF